MGASLLTLAKSIYLTIIDSVLKYSVIFSDFFNGTTVCRVNLTRV